MNKKPTHDKICKNMEKPHEWRNNLIQGKKLKKP